MSWGSGLVRGLTWSLATCQDRQDRGEPMARRYAAIHQDGAGVTVLGVCRTTLEALALLPPGEPVRTPAGFVHRVRVCYVPSAQGAVSP